MQGIDRQQVIGKSEDELDELTCSICQDIFDEPIVTQCCRQTYCKVCINQWLAANNTCPNDRKSLSSTQLTPAPRIVVNLLNKLTVKCNNYGKGCQSVLTFEEMVNHMKTCNTCDSCKSSKQLLAQKQKEIDSLENQLKDRINDIKELDVLLRTLTITSNTGKTEKDMITSARATPGFEVLAEKGLTADQKNFLVNLISVGLRMNSSYSDISNCITENIKNNRSLKPYNWTAIVGSDYKTGTFCHVYLCIKYSNDLKVVISANRDNVPQNDELKEAKIQFDQYKITERQNIDEDLFNYFIIHCKRAINDKDNFIGVSKYVYEEIGKKTKTKWIVMVNSVNNEDDYSLQFWSSKFICIHVNTVKVSACEVSK